jgi:3-oxoacyl-[acyl-carrier protein] reductase
MMEKIIAVVTGGTRGIGLRIAQAMVERGASIAITYLNSEETAREAVDYLTKFSQGSREILLLHGDAGNPDVVADHYKTVHKKWGAVNVLVNNAGIMPPRTFEEISIEDWNETLRINLSSAFFWSRQVVPEMKKNQSGRIVNISSLAARGGGVVGPHYAASKAGMLGLTRYAAKELGPYGITVNAIAPAFIEDAGIFSDWSQKQKDSLQEKILVPQLGNTKDVERAFNYLIDSPFVTGVTLDVNGGAFMI